MERIDRARSPARALVLATLSIACTTGGAPRLDADARPPPSAPVAVRAPSSSTGAAPSSSSPRPRPPLPSPETAPKPPRALIAAPPRPRDAERGWHGPVDRALDAEWLGRLASGSIVEITPNRGGATVTLRIRFADGARAVFKPEQTHSASNFAAEIAAYHVDRLLGLGRTAAVAGRAIGENHLRQHLEHADSTPEFLERVAREVVARDGRVRGAMIGWHTGRLTSAEPPHGWSDALKSRAPPPSELSRRLGEWTDMIAFDYLIDNGDRWTGGNILALGNDGPLIFLDNAAGFRSPGPAPPIPDRLLAICRFRKDTVAALRAVGPDAAPAARLGTRLERSLGRDPLAPVLSKGHHAALDARVAALLEHVERCANELGASSVETF
jgi:hypothetical protein